MSVKENPPPEIKAELDAAHEELLREIDEAPDCFPCDCLCHRWEGVSHVVACC